MSTEMKLAWNKVLAKVLPKKKKAPAPGRRKRKPRRASSDEERNRLEAIQDELARTQKDLRSAHSELTNFCSTVRAPILMIEPGVPSPPLHAGRL